MVLSVLLGWVSGLPVLGSEILARTQPTLLDLGIAIAAGGVGAFAKVRDGLSETLAGVAIAVALMPPVCVVGLGIARLDWQVALGAALLYGTNLLGITLASMVTFWLTGFVPLSRRGALILTGVCTAALVLPLSVSFTQLLIQRRLETSLRQVLATRTITFQRARLLSSKIDWLSAPPTATLQVVSAASISPKQVQLLERFVRTQVDQPLTLVLQVSRVEAVRSAEP